MTERAPWFRHKTYGYGAGLPMAWQGWVVLLVFALAVIVTMLGSDFFLTGWMRMAARTGGILISVVILAIVTKGRTEGGWRWRDSSE